MAGGGRDAGLALAAPMSPAVGGAVDFYWHVHHGLGGALMAGWDLLIVFFSAGFCRCVLPLAFSHLLGLARRIRRGLPGVGCHCARTVCGLLASLAG